MKKWLFLTIALLSGINTLKAQQAIETKYFIGGYYTFLIDPIYIAEKADSIDLVSHFLNVNFRYAFNRVWRAGVEYIMTFTSNDEVDAPFSTVGLTMDYDILRAKRSKLHLRAGLSFSNLSFRSEGLPQKEFVVNRVFGGSYEYRINKSFWVYGGFYHHMPFDRIELKEAMIQPFIGVCIGL